MKEKFLKGVIWNRIVVRQSVEKDHIRILGWSFTPSRILRKRNRLRKAAIIGVSASSVSCALSLILDIYLEFSVGLFIVNVASVFSMWWNVSAYLATAIGGEKHE